MKRAGHSKASSGFTMVELSVVISIVAVLIGGTLMLGNMRVEQEKAKNTLKRIALIERALKAYADVNAHLPCPANGEAPRSDPHFGFQGGNAGNCINGTVKANFPVTEDNGVVTAGVIPAYELGLPPEAIFDGWGRKFSYIIDRRYTEAGAFTSHSAHSPCGGLIVQNETGDNVVPNAVYAVISHGKDGHGAYIETSAAPFRINASVTNTSALENAHVDAAFNPVFNNVIRSHAYYEDPANPANVFDDIVVFKARKDMLLSADTVSSSFSANGKNMKEGWVYVPETTLPSGLVVPAFEVMKYEASNIPGLSGSPDGIPDAVPGALPWSGVTLKQARQACQSLGGHPLTSGGAQSVSGEGDKMEYDIIAETQWLAIAHQLAKNDANWHSQYYPGQVNSCKGTVNARLYQGHSDSTPNSALAPSGNDNDAYFGTLESAASTGGRQYQRRTFTLPNGSVLWDFAGNLREWSYCDLPGNGAYLPCSAAKKGKTAYDPPPAYGVAEYSNNQITNTAWKAFNVDLIKDGKVNDLLPPNNWTTAQGMGRIAQISAGSENDAILRGGDYGTGVNNNGIFQTEVDAESATGRTGFRCAHNFKKADNFLPTNLSSLAIWYDAADLDGDGKQEGASEHTDNLTTLAACAKTASLKNDGCIKKWTNKAAPMFGNPMLKFDAYSKQETDTPVSIATCAAGGGNDECMPTLKLNAMNGLPAINFDAAKPQWLDTATQWGWGYDFETATEFSIFIVANAQNYNAIIAGSIDDVKSGVQGWPHFVIFPYNMDTDSVNNNKDYVFLISNRMDPGGADATNNFCATRPGNGTCGKAGVGLQNYACAQMGGITNTANGLTHGKTHIATGIFIKGVANGMRAYVDGTTSHPTNSSVHAENLEIKSTNPHVGCSSGDVSNLMIGAQRGSYKSAVRTIGNVGEIIIYDRWLSNKERVLVEKYLAHKWGVTYKGPEIPNA